MVESSEPRPTKAFLIAVLKGDHDKILHMVHNKEIPINRTYNCQKRRYRMTPLCLVIQYCYNKDVVQALINAGGDVNSDGWICTYSCNGKLVSQQHVTPLYQALCLMKEGNRQHDGEELLRLLVHSGADVNKHIGEPGSFRTCDRQTLPFDSVRGTCLHFALELPTSEWDVVAELLLRNGADPSMENDLHLTPLHLALSTGMFHKAMLLIKYGSVADKNMCRLSPLNTMLYRAHKEHVARRYRSVVKRGEFYMVIEALMSSGVDLRGDTQFKESLTNLELRGLECEELTYLQGLQEVWLHSPLPLVCLCRMTVRTAMSSNCNPQNIELLNLPKVLKKYLNLDDIIR